MNQTSKGTYKKENFTQQFVRSCFGKIVILVVIFAVFAIIAHMTVPSEDKMIRETTDNVAQCIESSHGVPGDKSDDFVINLTATFSSADTTKENIKEQMAAFEKYNRIEVYPHSFYSIARIHNNYRPQGSRVALGIFGTVISMVNFRDFVLRTGVIRKEYNQRILRNVYTTDGYMGTNPDLRN